MALVTLEMGPTWRMQILLGVLEERGLPAFVEDSNLKTLDPFITGALSFDARLKVPEESVEEARTALAEARRDGLEDDLSAEAERAFAAYSGADVAEPQPVAPRDALGELADLGRRLRWAALFFWLHPFVFSYGVAYLRGLHATQGVPRGNGITLFALGAVSALWAAIAVGALRFLVEL